MSKVLSDGSVMPKYFSGHSPVMATQGECYLRQGSVTAAYYPDDEGNVSGAFLEYDVLVDNIDVMGMYSKVLYPRCRIMSVFGSGADFCSYTLRMSTIAPQDLNSLDTGAIVLLLCSNGDKRQGVIIGGVPQRLLPGNDNYKNLALADGANYVWEFNGIIFNVNDDGELIFTYGGATQNDGSLRDGVDSDNTGSTIKMAQDGSITLTGPGGSQSINIDNSGNQISSTAQGNYNVNAGANIKLQSLGVLTGAATDNTMLGTTYRIAQTAMHTQLIAELGELLSTLTTAGASISASATLLALPIGGTQLAAVPLAAAGVAISAAAPALAAMIAAISSFEAGSLTFLSLKNLSD